MDDTNQGNQDVVPQRSVFPSIPKLTTMHKVILRVAGTPRIGFICHVAQTFKVDSLFVYQGPAMTSQCIISVNGLVVVVSVLFGSETTATTTTTMTEFLRVLGRCFAVHRRRRECRRCRRCRREGSDVGDPRWVVLVGLSVVVAAAVGVDDD